MNAMAWKISYNSDYIHIDHHHKFLFDIVNQFIDAEGSDEVAEHDLSIMFDTIVDCFYAHFEEEEKLLKDSDDKSYDNILREIGCLSVSKRLKNTIHDKVTGSKKAASVFLKSRILHHLTNLPENCEILEQHKIAA